MTSTSKNWQDKIADFMNEPVAERREEEVTVDGIVIPQSVIGRGELNAEDLSDALLRVLIGRSVSFKVLACGDQSAMVRRLESAIEQKGMTCRIYTANRIVAAGGAALVTGAGVAAVAAIAAHNLATWNPDYEIMKDIVDNKVSVIFKKKPKIIVHNQANP